MIEFAGFKQSLQDVAGSINENSVDRLSVDLLYLHIVHELILRLEIIEYFEFDDLT